MDIDGSGSAGKSMAGDLGVLERLPREGNLKNGFRELAESGVRDV
jgi:hypothetical protein